MNLARLGDESVERFGEYTALHFEGRDLTNVDQHRTAARVAAALSRMDVGPGDGGTSASCRSRTRTDS